MLVKLPMLTWHKNVQLKEQGPLAFAMRHKLFGNRFRTWLSNCIKVAHRDEITHRITIFVSSWKYDALKFLIDAIILNQKNRCHVQTCDGFPSMMIVVFDRTDQRQRHSSYTIRPFATAAMTGYILFGHCWYCLLLFIWAMSFQIFKGWLFCKRKCLFVAEDKINAPQWFRLCADLIVRYLLFRASLTCR